METPNALPAIRQTLVMQAPVEKVWSAVATSEGIAAWFMPNDFRPELGYEFHLDAGPFGRSPCRVTELDPPTKLSFRWGQDWTVTFLLRAVEEGKTEFTLIHDGWVEGAQTEFGEPHDIVRDRMNGGWVGLVAKLGQLVEA